MISGTEFMEKYCNDCGSQRCEGIGTMWFAGCPHRDELLPEIAEGNESMKKKYKLGMYLGRFQPFHNGHKAIVDKMLEECEEVLIVVGSADKMGTMQNPFPAWERINMIGMVYRDKPVHIVALPDRPTITQDNRWGVYVMEFLEGMNFEPDVIYQGMETERNTWFEYYPTIPVVSVSRLIIPISATIIRAAIVEKDTVFMYENCPEEVYTYIYNSMYWGKNFK